MRCSDRIRRLARHLTPQRVATSFDTLGEQLSSDVLGVDIDEEGVAVITMNRPEAKNAFTFAMLEAFQDAFYTLGNDNAVRVIILTGSEDSFCTGTDLKELNQTTPENRSRGDRKVNKEAEEAREKEK